jgi:hypothetical protein
MRIKQEEALKKARERRNNLPEIREERRKKNIKVREVLNRLRR